MMFHVRSTYSNSNNDFFALNLVMNTHCDIYTREYKTLLNTLATIGGLFSPFKLFFDLLVMFYSDFENNSEIINNIFLLKEKYEHKMRNNILKQKDLDIEIPNEKKKHIKKKISTLKLLMNKNLIEKISK